MASISKFNSQNSQPQRNNCSRQRDSSKISSSKTPSSTSVNKPPSKQQTPQPKQQTPQSSKRFVTTSRSTSSFITPGLRMRRCNVSPDGFAYDLSHDELTLINTLQTPMKAVPVEQRELLQNGQRVEYLMCRNEHSPNSKYNYPMATSWRIGWLHNQQQQQQLQLQKQQQSPTN